MDSRDPRLVYPPHRPTDSGKLAALTASMEEHGWQGRPVLAYEYAGTVVAITGSHRIAAARAAGLEEIPVQMLDQGVLGDSWDWDAQVHVDGVRLYDQDGWLSALREHGADPADVALLERED